MPSSIYYLKNETFGPHLFTIYIYIYIYIILGNGIYFLFISSLFLDDWELKWVGERKWKKFIILN
ncbi:MAG: hypothetical protein N7Q72_02580, partial [Spiroplasma sp. Tabriz.8]|nr:hypothetical protein [Spiroplasma sp. Tabriz.8]